MIATALIVLPLFGAALCALPWLARAARALTVLVSLAVAALAGWSLVAPLATGARIAWVPAIGASYRVDVDGLSGVFVVLAGVVFAVGAAASPRVGHRRAYLALWGLLLAAVDGIFVARDLALFLAFWELALVTIAIFIWGWGSGDRRGATLAFVAHAQAGSALLLVAIVSMAVARGTLDIAALAARPIGTAGQLLPALFSLAAFAAVLPLFPFHSWLPRVLMSAPAPVAFAITGIVSTCAAYGILRICLGLFPQGMADAAPVLVALASVGALHGALVATRQDDLRGRIAYASLSQLSVIAVALFAATATSLRGAILAGVSHALVVAALLLLAAMLAARTSSFAISRAGGIAASAPVLAALSLLATLAAIGVPGTSGFAGPLLALAGSYERFPAATIATAFVLIVSAVYGGDVVRRAYHGPPLVSVRDVTWRERLVVAPLLALIIVLGLAPRLVTDRIGADALPAVEVGP